MTRLVALKNDEVVNEVELETRDRIRSKPVQNFIKNAKNGQMDIKCLCMDQEPYPLITVAKLPRKKDKFTLRRRHNYHHSEDCIFHHSRDLFYDELKECYKKGIFLEPHAPIANAHHINEDTEEERVRRYTFRHFCIDMFSHSISFTLNIKNKSEDKNSLTSKPLIMYTTEEYFSILRSSILNKKMSNGRKAKDVLPDYTYLSCGIIQEDLDNVQNGKLILKEFRSDKKTFYEIEVNISEYRLQITQQLQMNMGNILGGPYAYIAVYANHHGERKIIRLYTYAIQRLNDKFSFAESGIEREYANLLLEEDVAFIKPINSHEYEKIPNARYINNKRPELKFRPDVIEFRENGIVVVEICGYPNDIEYMRSLARKEQHYHDLEEKGEIKYTRWGG